MKRYVDYTRDLDREVTHRIRECLSDIVDCLYVGTTFAEEDPCEERFAENIYYDDDIDRAAKEFKSAIMRAYNRQMRNG